ncbi:MAG: DUF418 domain-containing protein [Verrucomicrobiales bacterium]
MAAACRDELGMSIRRQWFQGLDRGTGPELILWDEVISREAQQGYRGLAFFSGGQLHDPSDFPIGIPPNLDHLRRVNSPTLSTNRIESLDLIRGIAICGLVVTNSIEFGFGIELFYPVGIEGADRILWTILMGLGSGKFITLFAALFAAGMLLFCERAEATRRSPKSIYLTRLGWLFIFGLLHAYLLWHGDILVTYAVTGFVLFWCRNWSGKVFMTIACTLMALTVVPLTIGGVVCQFVDFSDFDINWNEIFESFNEEERKETEALTGFWWQQMKVRGFYAFITHLLGIPFYLFWFAAMLMSFGMALAKSGFFDGGWAPGRLRKTTIILLATGLPLCLGGNAVFALSEPSPTPLLLGYAAFYTGTPLLAFGYAGLGVMWSQHERPGFLRRGITAVGRMALTNYISHSIILGFIYYGTGLGLRDQLDLHQAMLIVPLIWIAQITASTWWLKRFRFGPLEWLWRRLTYGSIDLKKKTPPESSAAS